MYCKNKNNNEPLALTLRTSLVGLAFVRAVIRFFLISSAQKESFCFVNIRTSLNEYNQG